jgi:hypothetical protein
VFSVSLNLMKHMGLSTKVAKQNRNIRLILIVQLITQEQ